MIIIEEQFLMLIVESLHCSALECIDSGGNVEKDRKGGRNTRNQGYEEK